MATQWPVVGILHHIHALLGNKYLTLSVQKTDQQVYYQWVHCIHKLIIQFKSSAAKRTCTISLMNIIIIKWKKSTPRYNRSTGHQVKTRSIHQDNASTVRVDNWTPHKKMKDMKKLKPRARTRIARQKNMIYINKKVKKIIK